MRITSLAVTAVVLFFSVPSFSQSWFEYDNRADSFSVMTGNAKGCLLGFVTPMHGVASRGQGVERDWD
jgi:hypothetical protein